MQTPGFRLFCMNVSKPWGMGIFWMQYTCACILSVRINKPRDFPPILRICYLVLVLGTLLSAYHTCVIPNNAKIFCFFQSLVEFLLKCKRKIHFWVHIKFTFRILEKFCFFTSSDLWPPTRTNRSFPFDLIHYHAKHGKSMCSKLIYGISQVFRVWPLVT